MAAWVAALCFAGAGMAGERVLLKKQSAYNSIVVTEDRQGLRSMYFGNARARQSVVKPGDPEHIEARYAQAVPVAFSYVPRPERMLIVGLGGGTVPSFLHLKRPKLKIDVVELDPDVIEVARSHFGFRDDDTLRAYAGDGRRFIEQAAVRYDVILLDAFGTDSVPRALTTQEFLRGVRRATSPSGVVIGNVWGRGDNPMYDSMVRTYREVFDEVWVLDLHDAVNKLVIACPSKTGLTREEAVRRARALTVEMRLRTDLGDIVQRGLRGVETDGDAGSVLMDAAQPPSR